MTDSSVQSRLESVRLGIADAARLVNRRSEQVTLIAVSKTHTPEAIEPLIAAGQRDFGENRVQEAAAKWPELKARHPDVRLHLIGQLQSNKAEQAVELFDVIHSVDRSSLIESLARAADKSGRRPDCFLQVNLAEEPQKGGCTVGEIPDLLLQARAAGLPVIGLMCIPPADLEPAPWFALLAEHGRRHDLPALSMGMTADYPTAVTIGATHVRIGTALFGERARPA
jgi:PLP dependent protein